MSRMRVGQWGVYVTMTPYPYEWKQGPDGRNWIEWILAVEFDQFFLNRTKHLLPRHPHLPGVRTMQRLAKKFLGCNLDIPKGWRGKKALRSSLRFFIPGGLPKEDRDAFLAAVRSHVYVSDEIVLTFMRDWNAQRKGNMFISFYLLD